MNALFRIASPSLIPVLAMTLALTLGACKREEEKNAAAEAPAATTEMAIPGTEQEAPPVEEATPAPVAEAPQENRFAVAGIEDPAEVTSFLAALQSAVAADDREAVALMARYPFAVYDNGVLKTQYPNTSAFVAAYDTLFTQGVKDAIADAKPADLFVNVDGVMIGNGEVWIDNSTGKLQIKTINPM